MTEEELVQQCVELTSDGARKKVARRLAEVKLPCAVCLKEKAVDEYTVTPPPGTSGVWHPAWTLVEAGAWRTRKVCACTPIGQPTPKWRATDALLCYGCGKVKPRTNYDNKARTLKRLTRRGELSV